MYTGKAHSILRDGRRLPLNFLFGTNFDCSGYLHLNTSGIDPAPYADPMDLVCEDGTEVRFVVPHFSDRYLAVSGYTRALAALSL